MHVPASLLEPMMVLIHKLNHWIKKIIKASSAPFLRICDTVSWSSFFGRFTKRKVSHLIRGDGSWEDHTNAQSARLHLTSQRAFSRSWGANPPTIKILRHPLILFPFDSSRFSGHISRIYKACPPRPETGTGSGGATSRITFLVLNEYGIFSVILSLYKPGLGQGHTKKRHLHTPMKVSFLVTF